MASCVRNIRTKNYQNPIIGFQVTVENVGDDFLRHSVYCISIAWLMLLLSLLPQKIFKKLGTPTDE